MTDHAFVLCAVERLRGAVRSANRVELFGVGDAVIEQHVDTRDLQPLKRFVDLGHQYGKLVVLHTDGAMRLLIPDLIAIGFDGMQSVQPFATGMELGGLKRDFGDAFCFFGCVDTQALIETTPEGARQLTIDVLTAKVLRTAEPREVDETGKIVLDEGRWDVAKDRVSDRKQSADDKLDSALGKEQTREKDMEDLFDKAKEKLQKPKDFDF